MRAAIFDETESHVRIQERSRSNSYEPPIGRPDLLAERSRVTWRVVSVGDDTAAMLFLVVSAPGSL